MQSPLHNDPVAEERERCWNRRALWLLGVVLVVRVAYAAVFPLDLAPDESYYWDWGRRPDWGYFSKPPMIGWLMGLAGWLGGNSMFGLKVFPAVLTTAGLGMVFLLGRAMYGARAGFWAVAFLLATPAQAALSSFFTIDAPLFLCWSASLWLAWRWCHEPGWRWAVPLTLTLGLGALSKQIHLVFPLMLLGYLLLRPPGASRPSWAGWFAVACGSLLFLLPPLLWNWRHDWITFRHTADELEHRPFSLARSVKFIGEFVGGQAGLGGGISWLLIMVALLGALLAWRRVSARERYLLVFSLPGWLPFLFLALFQRVEQNWPMIFYTSGAVLLGGLAGGPGAEKRGWRRWGVVGVALGGVLGAALMLVPFVIPHTSMAGAKSDPTARVRGWKQLAREIEPFRTQHTTPGRTFLLAPDDRYVASALAFYLPDQPRTYGWEDPQRPESQYGIWGRPAGMEGWDALVVVRDPQERRVRDVAGRFAEWRELGQVVIRLGPVAARDRTYRVYLGKGFRGADPALAPSVAIP